MQMPRRSNNTIDFPDKAASGSDYNLTLPEDHPQSEQERRRRAWIHKHPIRITEVSCRWLEEPVRSTLEHFTALAARSLLILSGPRQAGQEELFGELMPSVATVDLDDPNSCSAAQDAPKTFLSRNAEKTVLLVLNAHRAPALLNVLIPSLSKYFLIVNQEGTETDKWVAPILSKRKIKSSEESFQKKSQLHRRTASMGLQKAAYTTG